MNPLFELLMLASLVGAVDVLYFHLYKFRLYEQPGSVAEELTHLARHVLFLGLVLVLLLAPPWWRTAALVLFGADLANSVADVLLERGSRAPLGGLPSVEYLLHVLATLLTGMAIATAWWTELSPLSGAAAARGWLTVGLGLVLLVVEGGLFARARA